MRGRLRRARAQLRQHLDHGPVRDPVAVGEAAAGRRWYRLSARTRRPGAICRRRLRRQPSRARSALCAGRPHTSSATAARARGRRTASRSGGEEPREPRRVAKRHRSALAFQLQRLERLGVTASPASASSPPRPGSRPAVPPARAARRVDGAPGREPFGGSDEDLAALRPIRPSIPSSRIASRISTAARTARRASSSCTAGNPNTAITASPMNFSTTPPWRSTSPASARGTWQQFPHRSGSRTRPARSSPRGRRRAPSRPCAAPWPWPSVGLCRSHRRARAGPGGLLEAGLARGVRRALARAREEPLDPQDLELLATPRSCSVATTTRRVARAGAPAVPRGTARRSAPSAAPPGSA